MPPQAPLMPRTTGGGSNYGPEDASGTTECTGPAAWNCGECDKNTEPVGELGDAVSDNVDYCPWLGHEAGIVYIEGVPGVHYPSIQAAIDAVTGTTILVGAGTYNEQLFIDQSMTIKSLDGADVTIIDGSGLTDLFWEVPLDGTTMTIYPVVWIDAAQVVFGAADQGFTITGATVYDPREGEEPPVEMGVGMLNRAAGCIIEDNIFDNNTIAGYMGMYMYESGSSNNQILDNEFCGNVMALWLMGGGGDTISGNSGNTFIENYLAIGLQMSNDNDIVGNTLRSNSMGIDLEGSHGNTISGNDISDTTGDDWVMGNTTIDGVAIELIGSNDNTISGNTISKDTEGHEAEWGIRLSGSSNNDIVGNNDISDCQYDGILLRGGYDDPQYGWIGPSNENLVQGNEVYDCDIGIAIEQSDNNDVLDNEVYGCATGIYLSSQGSGNEIGRAGEGNTVYYCEGGIMVEDSWDETVAGNTVYDCCVGIHLLNSHNITVEDNTTWADVEGESEVGNEIGICLGDLHEPNGSWENTIRDNDISYNFTGLWLDVDSHNNFVAANKIHENGHGIWIEGDNNHICANDIRYNTGVEDSGVHLTADAQNNHIHCNNIVGNTPYGMFKDGGNSTNARHNWWGDEYGPGGDGTGNGDAVGGPVNFDPWAETAFDFPDTTAPVIADTAAVSDTISLLDTDFLSWAMGNETDGDDHWYNYWYSVGPSYTDLIVDTGCDPCEACGVTVDLSALLLGMLPADFGDIVAGWDQDKRNEWDNWLNQLANTQMYQYHYWDEEAEQECYYWDYELWLDDLLIGGPWGDWCLTYFFEDGEGEQAIEFMNMVFEGFRLGEFEIPVTAFDCSGNENTDYHITLAIVDFQLPMKKGWNLRSTPISLDSNSLYNIVHLGDGLDFISILRWNAQQERWEQYAEPPSVYSTGWYYGSTKVAEAVVRPLEAYYIKLNDNDQLGFIINRDNSGMPERQLYVGWNLIGLAPDFDYWVFDGMPIQQALATIYLVEGDLHGWSVATSPFMLTWYDEEFYYNDIPLSSPPLDEWEGKPAYEKWFLQEPWTAYRPGDGKVMTTGGGYWVFMTNDGVLGGFSYTPLPWLWFLLPEP